MQSENERKTDADPIMGIGGDESQGGNHSPAERERLSLIGKEFAEGFEIMRKYPRSVTFFGSSRFPESHEYYAKARTIAGRIAKEGYAIVTGGGGGIMEAANRGAREVGGDSIGFNISLPFEQKLNQYVTKHMSFTYFFSRKVLLAFSAEAFIFFPGGFGTLDEFFEILTLIQTRKIPRVPLILAGNDYWMKLDRYIHDELLRTYDAIDPEDTNLYNITEDPDEIVRLVASAPLRDE